MNMEMVYGQFPVLKSDNLVLKKIEREDVQEVFVIYSNDKVFEFCGILPKHNIEIVGNMIGHFMRAVLLNSYSKNVKI